MSQFYSKVWKHYSSASPSDKHRHMNDRRSSRGNFVKKVEVSKKDQNMAYWQLDKCFGKGSDLLSIDETQRDQYIKEFGENALMQGYLRAKVSQSLSCLAGQ